MRVERRLFIDVKSHWSYVCVLCEKLELGGWKVVFRPELNAVDIIKYTYDGYDDPVDDMEQTIKQVGYKTGAGTVRSIYDLVDPNRQVRWYE